MKFEIGNIVRIKHNYGCEEVVVEENNKESLENSASGLPLSIDSLEKYFGFTSSVFSDRTEILKDIDKYLIRYYPDLDTTGRFNIVIESEKGVIAAIYVPYIHQLQNMFYWLTGLVLQ